MTDADARFMALQDAVAGTWSVECEVGRGGMATVYLARDVALDRPVAIKLLHAELTLDADARQRFVREARTGARLAHPHIVPIYDVVETAELVFLVMAYVDGETLGARLRREGPLAPDDVTRILREIGWALGAAHAAGVLHRDVTVDNILLERRTGRALLADFGIAEPIDGGSAGPLVGTPAYLAPELIHGEPASPASDLYALGVVGWTMLAGRLPFLDDTIAAVLLRQVGEPFPSLADAAPGTPSRLRKEIDALLAKDPARRPASAEAWLTRIEAAPTSVALATPLERWVALRDHLRPLHALALTSFGMLGAAGMVLALRDPLLILTYLPVLTLAVLLFTLVVQVSVAVRGARRAARAGYRIEDLRLALDRALAERAAAGPTRPALAGRLIRIASQVAGLSLIACLLMVLRGGSPTSMPFALRVWLWQWLLVLVPATWAVFWTLRGVGTVVPGRPVQPSDRRWRLRRRFWQAAVGARWFRLVAIGLGRRVEATSTLHRPTEMMLNLQIADLWQALPAGARHGLGDLPATAQSLHRRLDEVRRLLAVLETDPGRDPEAVALGERLRQRRERALDALERLRLLLLQLAGETAPEGELTRHLHDAQEVELALLEELGAHRAVRRLVDRGELSPTPA